MPTPIHPLLIAIEASTGSLTDADYVKITNFTSGGTIRIKANAAGKAVANAANEGFTWSDKDVVSIELYGRLRGSLSATITKGGIKKTVVAPTDAANQSAAVNL